MKQKKLMITGCGRSGTRYITSLLRLIGLKVKHEHMGRDGIVSWCGVVEAETVPWGDSIAGFQFEHIFHQVRHPLKVIDSLSTFKNNSWDFICHFTPCTMEDSTMVRSAKYWYYWNLMAQEKASLTYQIENLPLLLSVLNDRLALNKSLSFLENLPRSINTRNSGKLVHYYEEICDRFCVIPSPTIQKTLSRKTSSKDEKKSGISWDDLKDADSDLYKKIREKAQEYGYS